MIQIDPLRFAIAIGPLAIYLLVMGIVNLMSRPFVTTGARDMRDMRGGTRVRAEPGPSWRNNRPDLVYRPVASDRARARPVADLDARPVRRSIPDHHVSAHLRP